jgi:hypothetical protein
VSGGDGTAMLGIQRLIADAVADMLPTGEPVLAPSQQDPRNAPRCPIDDRDEIQKPRRIGIYVMSPAHTWFGWSIVWSRGR